MADIMINVVRISIQKKKKRQENLKRVLVDT